MRSNVLWFHANATSLCLLISLPKLIRILLTYLLCQATVNLFGIWSFEFNSAFEVVGVGCFFRLRSRVCLKISHPERSEGSKSLRVIIVFGYFASLSMTLIPVFILLRLLHLRHSCPFSDFAFRPSRLHSPFYRAEKLCLW